MKFKYLNQAPVLFSSTFKALNLAEKNSRTFTDVWEPAISMLVTCVFCSVFLNAVFWRNK